MHHSLIFSKYDDKYGFKKYFVKNERYVIIVCELVGTLDLSVLNYYTKVFYFYIEEE